MSRRLLIVLTIPMLFFCIRGNSQMTTRVIRDSLFIPWEMQYGPDNHIWFTQKNGYICRMEPASGKIDTLYHETNTVIQSEGGMLGLVLHPDFPSPPFVYVAYNYLNGSTYTERVVKYQYDATNNVLMNPQTVIDNIGAANFHNGCRLLMIGNYLYITTGDATVASTAQNSATINGKILRLLQDGSIPSDNPIPGSPIWSKGHRNAQGLVYANGKLYESEHGPNNDDEINIIQKGRNFGWPNVEGLCNLPAEITFCTDSNVVQPLKVWTPTLAVCGLDYYDHPMFPQFRKSLIMAALKDSKLYKLKLNATLDAIDSTIVISGVSYGRLRDICISPEGRIYISTSNSNASGSTRIDKIIEIYDPSYNSISTLPGSKEQVRIYPNPVTNTLTVAINPDNYRNNIQYRVLSTAGQTVAEGQLLRYSNSINTSAWSAGSYTIHISNGSSMNIVEKIIKQ